jgi:hypothetical protein
MEILLMFAWCINVSKPSGSNTCYLLWRHIKHPSFLQTTLTKWSLEWTKTCSLWQRIWELLYQLQWRQPVFRAFNENEMYLLQQTETTWHSQKQHDTAKNNTTQLKTTRHSPKQHDTAKNNTTQPKTTRHSQKQHDTAKNNTTKPKTTRKSQKQHDTAKNNMTQLKTTWHS